MLFMVICEKLAVSSRGPIGIRGFCARENRTIAIPVTSAGWRQRAPLVEEHGTRAQ